MKTLAALVSALMPLVTAVAAPGAVLIRNATVHTVSAAGVLEHTDLLMSDGKVADIGHDLKAPAGAEVIEANGKPVTPGLFGGLSHLGIEEIGLEASQDDYSLKLGSMRRSIAEHMVRSLATSPHAWTLQEVDVTLGY